MHIVFLSPHSDPEAHLGEPDSGGQCVYEFQLAQALSQLPDTKVTIFCRKNSLKKKDTIVTKRFLIRRVEVEGTEFIPKERIEQAVARMSDIVAKEINPNVEPTVLHGHYWDGGKLALHLLAKNETVVPFIYTPHSLGSLKRKKFQGRNNERSYNFIPRLTWENYSIFAANKIVVSTNQEKEAMVDEYNILPYKIQVIPPGVDFAHFPLVEKKDARKKMNLPQKAKILLCLGRMSRFKGYQHAIRMLKILKDKYHQPLFLVICGGSTSGNANLEESQYIQELQSLTQDLGLSDSVIFKPALSHDKVHLLYRAADIKIISAEHEPFGLTVIEAMANKLPVLATNNGGPASIISHNSTGILVDIFNYQMGANYLYSLLRDEEQYTNIQENAYQYVHSEYSWQTKAERFRKVYESVTEEYDRWFYEQYKQNYFLQKNL